MIRFFIRLGRHLRNPAPPLRVFALLVAVLLYGTTGFLYFELPENPDLVWADSFWWSVVTVTTVGYGDFFPATAGGRFIVAMPLMFFGIGLLGYVLSLAATVLIEAKTKELRGMSEFRFSKHLVIFNFPGTGKVERLLDELANDDNFDSGTKVVLIDEDLEELPPNLVRREVNFVKGNPTLDETLQRACIDTAAQAVVLCKKVNDAHSDDQNVAIALAIEARNPDVNTVVECVEPQAEELLRKAGCDSIVCTARFDALFLSSELLSPGIQSVLEELASSMVGQQIFLTKYAGGKPIRFGKLEKRAREGGHLALGVQSEGETRLNIGVDEDVQPGDRVVSIGLAALPPFS